VAGLFSALRITGGRLRTKFLFLGLVGGGIGAGDLTVSALMEEGLSLEKPPAL
jgi:malate dehydrogenase (oxaloacetate-decarboxylating)(NADP+)